MSYVQSYLATDNHRDVESRTPEEIQSMDLQTFNELSYREQLTVKQLWPSTYDRLVQEQEEQYQEEMKATQRY